jgi:hypothetical protein
MSNKEITIQGVAFEVSQPYVEGHVVTEAEAKALNQTRSENVRNNMAKAVKDAKETAAKEQGVDAANATLSDDVLTSLGQAVAEYDAAYIFTLASVGGGRKSKDPVEVEANKIARAAIMGKLKEMGKKAADVDKDALAAKIAEIAESPAVVKAAKKAVKERNELAASALDNLDL